MDSLLFICYPIFLFPLPNIGHGLVQFQGCLDTKMYRSNTEVRFCEYSILTVLSEDASSTLTCIKSPTVLLDVVAVYVRVLIIGFVFTVSTNIL